jgi:Tol biopolymer transport system component
LETGQHIYDKQGDTAADLNCSIIRCEIMALAVGTQLGSHEITALLGKGGMGEVYRARDTKLKREVAIKILPEEFARDAERVSRFQREAEVLASLNHPNIAAIYDIEEANGSRFLVLELVEGETLADRIARGPIPVEEGLDIAKQICDALQAAHDRGIIHRDLKPANVKLAPGGKVKVLDFGLAKAITDVAGSTTLSNSPTLMSGSIGGVIIGTAAYMSPEQARGMEVDTRTDIWAFGCVLYEILTSKPAFTGATATDIIAKIIERQPNWSLLPAETPSLVRTLLLSALAKDRTKRLQHIDDAPLFLNPGEVQVPSVAQVHASRPGRFITVALAAALLASLVPTTLYFLRAREERTAIRFEMAAPGVQPADPAISPDGQYVAYAAQADGKSAIWIRPMSEEQARPLAGTENGTSAFWSPDSRYIAFVVDRKLKKISIFGGPATTLTETPTAPAPGTWNRDGVILFTSIRVGDQAGIARVSESGGAVRPLGTTHRGGFADIFPQFLPDGHHFLYVSLTGPIGTVDLYAGSLDGGTPVHVASYGTLNLTNGLDFSPRYAAPGYLLFGRGGVLMAQPFDEKSLKLAGEPVAIAEHIGPFSASAQETLVYRPINSQGTAVGTQQVVWMDRKGVRAPSVSMPGTFGSLRLSPNGHRLALDQRDKEGNTDIWVIDLDRGVPDRLTFDPATDEYPRFSPDGKQIVYTSRRSGVRRMFTRPAVSIGVDQPLPSDTPPDMEDVAEDWSTPDGKYVVFVRAPFGIQFVEIWVKPMFGDGKPFPFSQSKSFVQGQPRLSPDSHWLAYMTNQTGNNQIVVQAFPDPNGGKTTVTAQGGMFPTWRGDGRELYYLALDGKIMAVPVKENGDKIMFGDPTPLFQSPLTIPTFPTPHQYDVTSDGKRFIFIANNPSPATPNDSAKLSVVVNWTALLRKK